MELSDLKRNRGIFLAVLGLTKDGKHLPCPFHNGSDCFDAYADAQGIYFWKCHAGCGAGTVIDAAMKKYGVNDCHAACLALEKEMGIVIGRDEEYQEPRLDLDRAENFITDAHKTLTDSPELQETFMKGKRGLTYEACHKYRIGFVTGVGFQGKSWSVFGWVIPITDHGGRLLGVKLHTEKPPWPEGPKCLWAPFGTYPASKPKHGTYTLWPAPEHWRQDEKAYLCPGELKALAQISAGVQSTAPTSGENKLPDRLVQRLARSLRDELFINYDDDAPKRNPATGKLVSPGNVWKDGVVEALAKAGVTALPFAHRRAQVASVPPASVTGHSTDALREVGVVIDVAPSSTEDADLEGGGDCSNQSGAAYPITPREKAMLAELAARPESCYQRTYDPSHFLV